MTTFISGVPGWLVPLLDRITRDPSTVVSPVIGSIRPDTFRLYFTSGGNFLVGGFNFDLKVSHILL